MIPTEITLHQLKREVAIAYEDGSHFRIPCLRLREHSPSAEQKHNPKPISPKVNITAIHPVGNYAVKFHFDDGHQSGIYSWEKVHELAVMKSE